MAAATEKSGIGRINFSEKSRPILPWYGFPDPLSSNSFSSWRRFINFLLLQFCHKAFMNDFILAVSHWKIRMKLSLGGSWKSGRISFMALPKIFLWKPSCKTTTTFKQRNLYWPPHVVIHWRYDILWPHQKFYANYILNFMPIIVIIDTGNTVQAISIPHNLLN